MKKRPFADAWGGIAGVQFTLSVLLQRTGADRGVPLERVVTLTSAAPARRFGIIGKGAISAGADADLAIVDRDASFVVDAASLQQRHKQSPYIGQRLRGIVKRTIRRGETIWHEGRITATGGGRLVRPARDGAVAPQSSF